MSEPSLRDLTAADLAAAAAVLADGMRDNPLHLAAFGDDPEHRRRVITNVFAGFLPSLLRCGVVFGTYLDDQLVGVAGAAGPGRCQPPAWAKLLMLPGLLGTMGVGGTRRFIGWFGEWAKHDPAEPHWHLGPVGVAREHQGQGHGSRLLERFAGAMDAAGSTGYLETDKEVNVGFYQRFGFEVVAQAEVIGVPNWFMVRRPR